MPNGGSDCCGTCWFRTEKKVEIKDKKEDNRKYITTCLIRDLEIPRPFWTYCANHPHHTKGRKIDAPLGPVYIDSGEYPYSRKIWKKAIDTEEIRLKLVDLVHRISNTKEDSYNGGYGIEEEALIQIGVMKEKRAVRSLLRIINFNIDEYRMQPSPRIKNKAVTVGLAIEALIKTTGCEYINELSCYINKGMDKIPKEKYRRVRDNFAIIRYHLVRGLEYCDCERADDLLKIALNDWHKEVAAFAQEIIEKKKRKG